MSQHWSNRDEIYQCVVCSRASTSDEGLDEDSCHPECRVAFYEDNPLGTPLPKRATKDPIFDENPRDEYEPDDVEPLWE